MNNEEPGGHAPHDYLPEAAPNPMVPETLPGITPAGPADYAIRFAAELDYLRERIETSRADLLASQRQTRYVFLAGLLAVTVLGFALFQFTRHEAKARANLKIAPAPSAPESGNSLAVSTVTFFHWTQGDPAVRLIRRNEGVCFLTRVSGHFEGDGECVRVWIDDDGYWYLGGQSAQQGVNADCAVLKW